MTDARLKGGWLTAMRYADLDDTTWRVFTSALMWCAENGTDGRIPTRYLRALHPDGPRPDAHDALAAAGLWRATADGYELVGWADELGQSTAQQVEAYKSGNRERTRRLRERRAAAARDVARDTTVDTTAHETDDVTRDTTPNVGIGLGISEGSKSRSYPQVAREQSTTTRPPRKSEITNECKKHPERIIPCERCAEESRTATATTKEAA